MRRRIFLDTEWTAPPWTAEAELMWIGLADEEGATWYGISSEAEIEPEKNSYISGAFRYIDKDEPRMTRAELAAAVVDFCGDVDEFWVWIPTLESFAQWSNLGDEAEELYAKSWDIDLQMLRALIQPWPNGWPTRPSNLNTAATEAKAKLPVRAENHLHPQVHAEWNRELFKRIQQAT